MLNVLIYKYSDELCHITQSAGGPRKEQGEQEGGMGAATFNHQILRKHFSVSCLKLDSSLIRTVLLVAIVQLERLEGKGWRAPWVGQEIWWTSLRAGEGGQRQGSTVHLWDERRLLGYETLVKSIFRWRWELGEWLVWCGSVATSHGTMVCLVKKQQQGEEILFINRQRARLNVMMKFGISEWTELFAHVKTRKGFAAKAHEVC